jgi:putative transposase
LPLLEDDSRRELFARAIDRACDRHNWRLAAFVFMPEHVHLIVQPGASPSKMEELLFAIKRPFSFQIKRQLESCSSSLLATLTVRQRPGVKTFRFWQEGPGYDRNLTTGRAILAAIDYLHANPVRRRLCRRPEEWRWSSARWFASDGCAVDADLPRLVRLPAGVFHTGARGDVH